MHCRMCHLWLHQQIRLILLSFMFAGLELSRHHFYKHKMLFPALIFDFPAVIINVLDTVYCVSILPPLSLISPPKLIRSLAISTRLWLAASWSGIHPAWSLIFTGWPCNSGKTIWFWFKLLYWSICLLHSLAFVKVENSLCYWCMFCYFHQQLFKGWDKICQQVLQKLCHYQFK